VALFQDFEMLSHVFQERSYGMGEILFSLMEEAFKTAGVFKKDISQIYVTLGPGSFTGLRVGIAAAIGLKIGLNKPLFGVSCLKAHARQNAHHKSILVILDARREDFYVQAFDDHLNPKSDPLNISLELIEKMFSNNDYWVCGDIVDKINLNHKALWTIDKSRFLKPLSIIQTPLESKIIPFYIRPPDVGIKS
jgi:tRNA threonylcarbamoyladenosine biosynthesis protein TsaB